MGKKLEKLREKKAADWELEDTELNYSSQFCAGWDAYHNLNLPVLFGEWKKIANVGELIDATGKTSWDEKELFDFWIEKVYVPK